MVKCNRIMLLKYAQIICDAECEKMNKWEGIGL